MTTATSGTGARVRVLQPVDRTAATTLLARGFAEEPGNLVLLPDEDVRQAMIETGAANALRSTLRYGTAPEHRGRGLARALLDRQLGRCDEDAAAVWLETTDPVNPPIYERFGFTTVAHLEEAAWLPGLWVMRREPVGSGTAAT